MKDERDELGSSDSRGDGLDDFQEEDMREIDMSDINRDIDRDIDDGNNHDGCNNHDDGRIDDDLREDVLLSRAIDGNADSGEWTELELMAGSDSGVWRRLATTLRGDAEVRRAMDSLQQQLDSVELPRVPAPVLPRPMASPTLDTHRVTRGDSWARGGWWAAAASIMLWVFTGVQAPETQNDTAPDNLVRYLEQTQSAGNLVGMLPRTVFAATPSADGHGVDVVSLRGWVERQEIDQVYQYSEDEQGRVVPIPVPMTQIVNEGPY